MTPLSLTLIDQEGNIVTSDSESIVRVVQLNSENKVYGTSSKTLMNGKVDFTDIVFESMPGKRQVEYEVVSNAISIDKLRFIINPGHSNLLLSLDFRECTPGEAQINTICEICPVGKYTFEAGAEMCLPCLNNALCEGGNVV